jgi:hypothetical protein
MIEGIEMKSQSQPALPAYEEKIRRQSEDSLQKVDIDTGVAKQQWYHSPYFKFGLPLLLAAIVIAVVVGVHVSKSEEHCNCVLPPGGDIPNTFSNVAEMGLRFFNPPGVSPSGDVTATNGIFAQIPFKVVAILPSDGTELSSSQLLTVAYSKPVLPLGSNFDNVGVEIGGVTPAVLKCNSLLPVAGKWRWVTTSILRFDPDKDWANNLKCTVEVSTNIKAVDGMTLDAKSVQNPSYTSPSFYFTLNQVSSELATAATGGLWAPSIGTEQLMEVPSDGVLTVQLPQGADVMRFSSALKLSGPNANQMTLNVTASSSTSANIRILGSSLQTDSAYSLTIPSGTSIQPYGGPTTVEYSVQFSGLHPFTFPFQITNQYFQPSTRRFRLWVRHGIRDVSTIAGLLTPLITITPTVKNVAVSVVNVATLELSGDFEASTTYKIDVADGANVADGLGLTLKASSISFATNYIHPRVSFFSRPLTALGGPAPTVQCFIHDASTTEVAQSDKVYGCEAYTVTMREITSADSEALVRYLAQEKDLDTNRYTFTDKVMKLTTPTSPVYRTSIVPTTSLLKSGLAVVDVTQANLGTDASRCQYASKQTSLVANGTYSITAVQRGSTLLVWVTETMGRSVATASKVELWRLKEYYAQGSSKLVSSATTNTQGVATVDIGEGGNYVIIATVGNQLVVTRNYFYPMSTSVQRNIVLHTDRKVYKPNDVVFIKGYIREYDAKQNAMVSPPARPMNFNANWGDDKTSTVSQSITDYEPAFGSFSARLTVPPNAKYRATSITLDIPNVVSYGQSTTITISDPRIPTNVFDFASPNSTLRPSSPSVLLKMRTATYAGSPVPQSKVDLSYSISGPNATSGSASLVTNDAGTLGYILSIPKALSGGLTITATWLTPTRETLTQTVTMPVADSLWGLVITNANARMVPSLPSPVSAVLTLPVGDTLTGSPSVTFTATYGTNKASCVGLVALVTLKATCALTLPTTGSYSLVATVQDPNGFTATSYSQSVGLTDAQWISNPVRNEATVSVAIPTPTADATSQTVQLEFTNPFTTGTVRALIWTGNMNTASLDTSVTDVAPGTFKYDLKLPTVCTTGCNMGVAIVLYGASAPSLTVAVATSDVEDYSAPKLFTYSTTVRIAQPSRSVVLSLAPAATVVEPGSTLRVSLTAGSLSTSARTEVAVMVVDKAILDVMVNPLPDLPSVASADMSGSSGQFVDNVREGYISELSLQRLNANFVARLNGNPWAQSQTNMDLSAFHMSATNWLASQNSQLTYFPYIYVPYQYDESMMEKSGPGAGGAAGMPNAAMPTTMSAPAPAPPPGNGNDLARTASSTSTAPASTIRTQFSQSPIFYEKVIMTGTSTQVDLKLPDNVGTWVVKVLAVTSEGTFATSSTEVIARKQLGMVPSVPRLVRYGDKFTAGVVVTLFASAGTSVTISAQPPANLKLTGSATSNVQLTPNSPREVLFSFEAAGYCESCAITFVAISATNVSDGLLTPLPLLAAQQIVYMGTSFSLMGSNAQNWTEGIEFPAAIPGSGFVSMQCSVGRYSAVKSIGQSLLTRTYDDESGPRLLEIIAPYVALDFGYAQTVGAPAAIKSRYTAAVARLPAYTLGAGLQYSLYQSSYQYIDVRLNLNALYLSTIKAMPADLVTQWTTAVNTGIVNAVEDSIRYKYTFNDYDTVALIFLVLGPDWQPPASDTVKSILSFNTMMAHVSDMSVTGRAVLLNVLQLPTIGSRAAQRDSVATSIMNNLRITGRTAYVSVDKSDYHCSMACQGMALMGLSRLPQSTFPQYLIEKIANLVSEGLPNSWWWGTGGFDVVVRMIALASYDKTRQSSTPSLHLTIQGGNKKSLVDTKFEGTEGLQKQYNSNYTFAELSIEGATGPSPMSYQAVGAGEVSVSLGLTFAPALNSTKPKYFGLFVEKVTKLVRTGAVLTSPYTLNVGDIIEVTMSVTSPDDVTALVLEDFLAGGIEAQDPNLAVPPSPTYPVYSNGPTSSSGIARGASSPTMGDSVSSYRSMLWYEPWRYIFAYKEVKADRVVCVSTYFPSGTALCKYYATAVTSGTFVSPAAKASLSKQPEVMGLSATEQVVVLPRSTKKI